MVKHEISRNFIFRQILLAMCLSIGYFAIGLSRGFPSPGIPSMEQNDPHLVQSEAAISLITSIPPLGGALGTLISASTIHWTGRKRSLLMVGPFYSLFWIGLGLSNSNWMVVLMRVLINIVGTICLPAAQIYLSECSDAKTRGILGSILPLSIVFGTTAQYLIGVWMDWRMMAFISASFPVLMTVILWSFPESPVWLNLKKDETGMMKATSFYGVKGDIPEEMLTIGDVNLDFVRGVIARPVLVPFLLTTAVFMFTQLCGNDAVASYCFTIFRRSGTTMNPHLASMIVMAIHVVFIIITFFIVDRYGRKILLLISSMVMALSMAALGTSFLLQKTNQANMGYLPLISLMVFISGYSVGYSTVPFILLGEMIPLKYRGPLSAIAYGLGLVFMSLQIKSFSFISANLGDEYPFFIFSFANLIAFLFVLFYLPETKGKSLNEIEEYFKSQNSGARKCFLRIC